MKLRHIALFAIAMSQSVAMAQNVSTPAALPGMEDALVRRNWFWAGAQIVELMIPAAIVFLGFGARLRTLAAVIARRNWYGTLTLTAIMFLFAAALLQLPYDLWRATETMGMTAPMQAGWWFGKAMNLLVRFVAAALFVWIPYALMAFSPRRWWLYAGAFSIPASFLVLIALPVWVDPLTTTYHPLANNELHQEIQSLASRCGVEQIPVFVGGNDTTVVGLGPTNRIILGEDLLRDQKLDQLRFTVGHELKHYVMGDNFKSVVVIFAVMLLGFFATHKLGGALIARFHARFGFDKLSDPASLPLGIFILTLTWLCVLPLFNWYGRYIEFEADRFSLELTHENHGLAQMEADYIAHGDVPDWGPFFRIFRATHPTDGERIRFANRYHPWETNEPLTYAGVCKPAN